MLIYGTNFTVFNCKIFLGRSLVAVRSSDDNIRDDGGNLENHGRRFEGLLPFFCVTDFLLPLLSPQKNGIIGITNIFKEADCVNIYVDPDHADFHRCL